MRAWLPVHLSRTTCAGCIAQDSTQPRGIDAIRCNAKRGRANPNRRGSVGNTWTAPCPASTGLGARASERASLRESVRRISPKCMATPTGEPPPSQVTTGTTPAPMHKPLQHLSSSYYHRKSALSLLLSSQISFVVIAAAADDDDAAAAVAV